MNNSNKLSLFRKKSSRSIGFKDLSVNSSVLSKLSLNKETIANLNNDPIFKRTESVMICDSDECDSMILHMCISDADPNSCMAIMCTWTCPAYY